MLAPALYLTLLAIILTAGVAVVTVRRTPAALILLAPTTVLAVALAHPALTISDQGVLGAGFAALIVTFALIIPFIDGASMRTSDTVYYSFPAVLATLVLVFVTAVFNSGNPSDLRDAEAALNQLADELEQPEETTAAALAVATHLNLDVPHLHANDAGHIAVTYLTQDHHPAVRCIQNDADAGEAEQCEQSARTLTPRRTPQWPRIVSSPEYDQWDTRVAALIDQDGWRD